MIKDFTPRLYQETILATCVNNNTLVVLPTGMGKTNVFLMLAAHRIRNYPTSKILFIGPTKPLIDQYLEVFKKHFDLGEEKYAIFTGMVKPEKREQLWKTAQIIFSTPQGLENDIISNRINLEEVSLLGVDEAHRAVGDYSYVFVAKQYEKKARYPRIIALTASPGSDMEKIKEVCNNLFIEKIEVRTEKDADVKPYVQEVDMKWVEVSLPTPFIEIQKLLKEFLKERFQKLKSWGILQKTDLSFVTKKDLLALQAQLRGRVSQGEKEVTLWSSISLLAEIMKMYHSLELLESQGIVALHKYLSKIREDSISTKVKAVKNIVGDINFRSAFIKTQKLLEEGVEHPKLIELQKIIKNSIENEKDTKIIVFNQYRDNAGDIGSKLNTIGGVKAKIFVGQNKKGDTGLTQKEQKEILDQFREGEFNVLVATSIGEEGLDIPKVDQVIFYEPIPSAIRTIQRKGRTGRLEKGSVIVLVAKGTRDEGYRWSAHHKQKRMYRNLDDLKRNISFELEQKKNHKLENFTEKEQKIKIIADHREKGSGVIKELVELNTEISLDTLENADYLLSSRVGVEFKTTEDFVNSIIDGRLLEQIKELKRNFERPVVLIEGTNDIYSIRNIHANAIRGMLATIAVSYGIPILHSRNAKETAALLTIIAKREQEISDKDYTPHSAKRTNSLKDMQEYLVSSLPGVGMTLAKPILKAFKTIKNIVNADVEQLKEVEKIGPKKAQQIKDVFEKDYEG